MAGFVPALRRLVQRIDFRPESRQVHAGATAKPHQLLHVNQGEARYATCVQVLEKEFVLVAEVGDVSQSGRNKFGNTVAAPTVERRACGNDACDRRTFRWRVTIARVSSQ